MLKHFISALILFSPFISAAQSTTGNPCSMAKTLLAGSSSMVRQKYEVKNNMIIVPPYPINPIPSSQRPWDTVILCLNLNWWWTALWIPGFQSEAKVNPISEWSCSWLPDGGGSFETGLEWRYLWWSRRLWLYAWSSMIPEKSVYERAME